MSLIQCPDCRRQVSARAPTCPNCGAPIAVQSPLDLARSKKSGEGIFLQTLNAGCVVTLVIIGIIVFLAICAHFA